MRWLLDQRNASKSLSRMFSGQLMLHLRRVMLGLKVGIIALVLFHFPGRAESLLLERPKSIRQAAADPSRKLT